MKNYDRLIKRYFKQLKTHSKHSESLLSSDNNMISFIFVFLNLSLFRIKIASVILKCKETLSVQVN